MGCCPPDMKDHIHGLPAGPLQAAQQMVMIDPVVRAQRVADGQPVDMPCLFAPPAEVLRGMTDMQAVCRHLLAANRPAAVDVLLGVDEPAVRRWWDKSQCNAAWWSAALAYEGQFPAGESAERERPQALGRSTEREVFERDGYRCRYCEVPVLARRVRMALDRLLPGLFPVVTSGKGADARSHAVSVALTGVVDHVHPQHAGGANTPDNLVTACGPCNYSKGRMRLAALGLADPFLRPPVGPSWDGGVPLLALQLS